ncbi:unnamed protein product [Parajaminaea phylloscopi]
MTAGQRRPQPLAGQASPAGIKHSHLATPSTARQPLAVKNVQGRAGAEQDAAAALYEEAAYGKSKPAVIKTERVSATEAAKAINGPARLSVPARVTDYSFPIAPSLPTRTAAAPGFNTPRKRSVPREDVHARNVVLDTDDGSPPHKRSRSSKDTEASSGVAPSVESAAGTNIAKDLTSLAVEVDEASAATAQGNTKGDHRAPRQTDKASVVAQSASLAPHRSTTQRIDRHHRMSAAERAAREESQRAQMMAWRKKYAHAFASFSFYLDGFDQKQKDQMARAIQHCGGKVELFFDKTCTHVVSAHKTPSSSAPAQSIQTSATASRLPVAASRRPETKRFSPSKKGLGRKNREMPLHSDRNPFEDSVASMSSLPVSDVVRKATGWGIRVWAQDKFWSTIKFLVGHDASNAASVNVKQDLAKMLEYERINGTSERDVTAPQSGWRYLDKRQIYILVGDATEEHHAIMFHEFRHPDDPDDTRTASQKSAPGTMVWPKLYGEHEGRCPFTKYASRRRDNRGQEEAEGAREGTQSQGVSVAAGAINGDVGGNDKNSPEANAQSKESQPAAHDLRQRTSHTYKERRAIDSPAPEASRDFERGMSPYQLASGNSVSVASNITSAMSHVGSTASFPGGISAHGGAGTPSFALQDKRVAQLGRRTVSSASHMLPSPTLAIKDNSRDAMTRSASLPKTTDPAAHGALVRQMLGMSNDTSAAQSASVVGRNESGLIRSVSMNAVRPDAAYETRRDAVAEPRGTTNLHPAAEKERKTLFCENCRKKFHDFDKHINSSEHRRFALNASNFAQVDDLLSRLDRPIAPWVRRPEYAHIVNIANDDGRSIDDGYEDEQSDDPDADVDVFDSYIVDPDDTTAVEETDELSQQPKTPEHGVECPEAQSPQTVYEREEAVDDVSPHGPLEDVRSFEWHTSVEEDGDTTPHTSPGLCLDAQDCSPNPGALSKLDAIDGGDVHSVA